MGVFPLFLKMVAVIIVPKLSILFCGLIHPGSFPECWQSPNVTTIPRVLHPLIGKTAIPFE